MSRTASRFQGISFATALHPEQPHCERTPFVTLILPADVVNRDAEAPSSTIGSPGLARTAHSSLVKKPSRDYFPCRWLGIGPGGGSKPVRVCFPGNPTDGLIYLQTVSGYDESRVRRAHRKGTHATRAVRPPRDEPPTLWRAREGARCEPSATRPRVEMAAGALVHTRDDHAEAGPLYCRDVRDRPPGCGLSRCFRLIRARRRQTARCPWRKAGPRAHNARRIVWRRFSYSGPASG